MRVAAFVFPDDIESTAAALYDVLQRWWGAGTWDEECSVEPWWQHRMKEIGKVKGYCSRCKVDVRDMALAVRFMRATGVRFLGLPSVRREIMPARDWWRTESGRRSEAAFEKEYALAISGATGYAKERLLAAQGPGRAPALAAWLAGEFADGEADALW